MNKDNGHILVVDDYFPNRLKLSLGLAQQGHTVAEAENGRRALEILRSEPFDLVLLDILMPEMDGYEVLEQMKKDPALREIPVIVISAQDEVESIVRGIELGAEDYLPKTFNPVLLKARIDVCLEKKRLRDQKANYLARIEEEKSRSEKLLKVVIPIGAALPREKDFNRLLEKILLEARTLCYADGGTLYLRTDQDRLEFVILRNESLNIAQGGTTGEKIPFEPLDMYDPASGLPNRADVVTRAALSGVSINIADTYQEGGLDFSSTRVFDQIAGYQTRSCLTIPLKTSSGHVIGVLQLLNARNPESGEIVSFDVNLQQLIESLSSLAAAALEVYRDEQNLRRQIEQLRIEVDEARQSHQVAEITESDYFQHLEAEAESLREIMSQAGKQSS